MPKSSDFIGRQRELDLLNSLTQRNRASMVVIKGRRRIGKSRLAMEFAQRAKGYEHYYLTGLPPEKGITPQQERDDFAEQLSRVFNIPKPRGEDWNELFWVLADRLSGRKAILILDEINWLGSKDATFLGKLKSAWDRSFSMNPHLIVILSGSLTGWIEDNVLHSTGFVGRINLDITLNELSLQEAKQFWPKTDHISVYEMMRVFCVTGGVPRYLEEINYKRSSDANIRELCFTTHGLFFREFDDLFNDLFQRRNSIYRDIVLALSEANLDLAGLHQALEVEKSGSISRYVDDLVKCGFLARDFTWKIKDGKESKLSRIRIRDNYLRFYLKAILPNRNKIERGSFAQIPNLDGFLGLQFENIVLNNRQKVWDRLQIDPGDIVCENPFFQRATQRAKGCQIDYAIQTRMRTLYICEIKFKKTEIRSEILVEMEEKIARLSLPRNFSVRPVLIHVNGVSDEVAEHPLFDAVLSMGDLF